MASPISTITDSRRWLAYAQLLRLPNSFTAMADISLAALVAGALPDRWYPFALLLLASTCLYCSGMVWNDFFDVEKDQRERPSRPLASGRIALGTAFFLGSFLMAGGVALVYVASMTADGVRIQPMIVVGCLTLAILLYDGWLKRTVLGPFAMGTCRFLNVLLGLTVMPGLLPSWGVAMALVVGIYIVGVTWFARTEAVESNQNDLIGAAAVMGGSVLFAVALPVIHPNPQTSFLFLYLLAAFAFVVGLPIFRAIKQPSPRRVQPAIKTAVLGLIALDAVLATAIAGIVGLAILILLIPAIFLGRWLYST